MVTSRHYGVISAPDPGYVKEGEGEMLEDLLALVVAGGLLGPSPTVAQAGADCAYPMKDAPPGVPSFSDYVVKSEPAPEPAPLRIRRHTQAWQFRTTLREEYENGKPNFAGHYRIEGWGCGTACLDWAVVDVRTGGVTFDPAIRVVAGTPEDDSADSSFSQYGFLGFRKDSRLLIMHGAPSEPGGDEGIGYYVWNGNRFSKVAFFSKTQLCSHALRD